jgi:hypothetical protein
MGRPFGEPLMSDPADLLFPDDFGIFLRTPIGPGCTVTIWVSREPSSKELELLIKFIQVAIGDPQRPLLPPSGTT